MVDVLEQWMTKAMGYIVKLNTPEVGEKLYDGTIYHDILCKNNIINIGKCPAPPREPSTEIALQSLVDLGLWFKLLGITHSREILESAADKDPRACMQILFELYAKLQTRDDTHFLMKQKAEEIQQEPASRFSVKKADEPVKPLNRPPAFFHLEDCLRDSDDIVDQYKVMKEKLANWSKLEMRRRREVVKKWSERETFLTSDFEQTQPSLLPQDDPIEMFKKTLGTIKPKEEYLNVTNEGYVAYLRQKRKKTSASNVLKMKMQKTLVHDLWAEILGDRDKELTEAFEQILLQPCEYETKLTSTLQKLHDNYKNFSEFSNYINTLAEDEYSQAENLHKTNKKQQKELAKEREMERVLELHKRLAEEKLRVKRENHTNDCERIVNDMIDYSIKIVEYNHKLHTEPSKKVNDEWKELFFKGLPILREPRNFFNELEGDDDIQKPVIQDATNTAEATVGVTNDEVKVESQLMRELRMPSYKQTPNQKSPEDDANWKVLMDFEKFSRTGSSIMRFPNIIELKSKDITEDFPQGTKEDVERLLDRDIVDCLNNYNLRTYLNTFGPWDLKQWPEIWPVTPFDEKLNVLGYAVHRLLDLKYALPKGPKRPMLPKFQIKVILGKFLDSQIAYILESLKDLLMNENVEVIDVSIPVNYCLNVYKQEMEITEVGSMLKNLKSAKDFEDGQKNEEIVTFRRLQKRPPRYPEKPLKKEEDQMMIQPRADTHGLGRSSPRKSRASRKSVSRKSKIGRKSVARKSKAGGRKSVARKSKAGGRKSVARKSKVSRKSMSRKSVLRSSAQKGKSPTTAKHRSASGKSPSMLRYAVMSKATQIPSLPDLNRRYKHSPAGKLGKVAFETLAEGNKLNNALLGNMLIEYLKSLDNKRGFALVNFPTSALQANIFEHQFNGLPLEYPLRSDSEVDLFRTAEPSMDVQSHLRCFLDFEKLLRDYVKEPEPPQDSIEELLAEEEDNAEKNSKREPMKQKSTGSASTKSIARKSVSRRKSSKRQSVSRRKSSKRQSAASRKSKAGRKSLSRKSIKRKSTAGAKEGKAKKEGKTLEKNKIEEKKEETTLADFVPIPQEPPKAPLTLEQLNRFRISEILPRPNKDLDDLLTGTSSYFTSYIHPLQIQSQKRDIQEQLRIKKGPFDQNPTKMLVNEKHTTYAMYKQLGIITEFDYMRFDTETIKRLARVILGVTWDEDDLTRKPSIELFGVRNLEKVEKGPQRSDSSESSKGSRASYFENEITRKFLSLEADQQTIHRKYVPIKPLPLPLEPALTPEVDRKETDEDNIVENGRDDLVSPRKSKTSVSSRKSIRRSSRKSVARKSMKRKSKTSGKRQSVKRKSQMSVKRKSTAGGSKKSSEKPSPKEKEQEDEAPASLIPKAKPGEDGWIYVNEPIPYEAGFTAASLWECSEYAYLESMEKIFYLLRTHDMKLLPYREHVKTSLQHAMHEENEKRHLVTNFQLMLNKVDDDFRQDEEMKLELYVRANELNDIMTRIAMERRQRSLMKKEELITQGAVANHVYTLANLYLSMMQVEMDLYVDSLQVLNDYYLAMLGDVPKAETQSKFTVVKNRMANEGEIMLSGRQSSIGSRRRRKTVSKSSTQAVTLRQSFVIPMKIQKLLSKSEVASSSGSSRPEPNPTYPLVSQIEHIKSRISSLKNFYQAVIKEPNVGKGLAGKKMGEKHPSAAEKTGTSPALALGSGKRPKRQSIRRQSKRQSSVKRPSTARRQSKRKSTAKRQSSARRQSKRKSMAKRKSSVRRQSSKRGSSVKQRAARGPTGQKLKVEEIPNIVDVAKDEWLAAVEYQVKRTEFRLQLIEARAKTDLDGVLDMMKELFFDYQNQVDDQLMKEVTAIDDCMYVFKRAIEEGSPIQAMMVLDDNRFYIDRKILLFPDPPPPPPPPMVETSDPYSFTVKQMNTLVVKFSQMAPLGSIETPMIEVLSEMAIAGHESGNPTLPSAWANLDRMDYKEIFTEAYADQTCLDWRNFIINIANLPYPTIAQLQGLKKEYMARDVKHEEIVTLEDFESIPLWFENELGETIEEDLKLSLAKSLIFNMFKINDREMNYYDMLMGYCRAEDPEDGLGMALDLLLDSGYILQPGNCLREDEFEKIHPRKIIDYILVNFFTDLLNLTGEVQLTYLPPLTNAEVFASAENEFEISEDILRQNRGTRKDYGDLSSTDSETNLPKPERVLYLDDDDEMPAKYMNDKWQMCVPYEVALALILNALNFYALSPIYQHRILNIEKRLKDLYTERGTGTHLKAYRLTSSDLFKDLYGKTNIFKKTNITGMVERIIVKKRGSEGRKSSD